MVVQEQADYPIGGIVRVDCIKQLDELATAVAITHHSEHMPQVQFQSRDQRNGAMALVLVIARQALIASRHRRQIRSGCGNGLNSYSRSSPHRPRVSLRAKKKSPEHREFVSR